MTADGTGPRRERAAQLALAGELAARVAHEIKNPLAPIRGYAQMMADRLESVAEPDRALFERGLSIIQTEVQRIDARLGELLGVARAGADADATFDVTEALEAAAALAAGIPGVTATAREDGGVGRAHGDADAIRGALLNLVTNAAEAMAPLGGGALTLRARATDDDVVIEVADEGPGLPEGRTPEAPFTSTKPGGTGLGLAVAGGAARAAGGRLELEDRTDRPAGGAVARLVLPRA